MASRIGNNIAANVAISLGKRVLDGDEIETCAKGVDAELQEVRAVFSLTADRRYPAIHGHCWCRKDLTDDKEPHSEFCQRARALAERLEIK